MWSIDNLHLIGELKTGQFVLLRDGHEVARGTDALLLMRIADTMNAAEDRKEKAA